MQARSSIDTSTTHRIAAGMTTTKYNSKHRIVDEDVRDAQRRARAVAVAEEKTRLLHARLLEVRPSVSTCGVPHELTLAVVPYSPTEGSSHTPCRFLRVQGPQAIQHGRRKGRRQ